MADQLSPDEKFDLITRNLQVAHLHTFKHTDLICLKACSCESKIVCVNMCIAGGPWWGEAEAGSKRERDEGVLGYSNHWQTSRGLLCPHVQDCRLPQGWVWGENFSLEILFVVNEYILSLLLTISFCLVFCLGHYTLCRLACLPR